MVIFSLVEHGWSGRRELGCAWHSPYATSLWANHVQRTQQEAGLQHVLLTHHQHPLSIQVSCPDLVWKQMAARAMALALLQARSSWENESAPPGLPAASGQREEGREAETNRNPGETVTEPCRCRGQILGPSLHSGEGPLIGLGDVVIPPWAASLARKAQMSVLAEIRGCSGSLSHRGPTVFGSRETSKQCSPEARPGFLPACGPWEAEFPVGVL